MDPKEEIKSRVNIADLVAEYLPLKPAGPSRFRGLCPFHAERTPSFHVSADKQIWHCFGCSEGGDCFSFVMRMEGMDFPEALLHLGKKVGVEVPRYSANDTNEKRRLMETNELAAKFFRKTLLESPGAAEARAYLARRGIDDTLAEKFGLGFALESWDALTAFLTERGFQPMEQEKAGLALNRRSGSGVIDRFRARVMIPLCDQHGNVVGFTGRIMPSNSATFDEGPKYMNSPETLIYRKGHLLYGLHLAKQAIKREGRVVIVEGNLDVVASHKAGVEHVVGSSGTALTEDQLGLLKRFTNTIVFSFDADAAGFKAAQRGIALARTLGFDVRVAVLPADAGKDPDEAVQKDPQLWRDAATKTVPIMQYYLDRATAGRDLANVDHKRAVAALLIPELAQTKDVIEREHWLQTLSDLLRTDIGALRKEVAAPSAAPAAPVKSKPAATSMPAIRFPKEELAARSILGVFIQDPELRPRILAGLAEGSIPTEPLRLLYSLLRQEYDSGQSLDQTAPTFGRLRDRQQALTGNTTLLDEIALLGEELVANMPPDRGHVQIQELLDSLKASDRDRRRKAIEAELRRAEASGDRETVEKLIREFNALR